MTQRKKSKLRISTFIHKGFVLLLLGFLLSINCSKKPKDINVILISIDTLRSDHLSCYGYKRNTSPFLDKIAKDGILFKNVISSSSWTSPAMASLFTSLNSSKHGVSHGIFRKGNVYNQEVLTDSLVKIPAVLKERGFFTMGFSTNPHLDKKFGFAKGFDVFVCSKFIDARKLNKVILKYKSNYLKKNKKFFLWIHYFDPHWPYLAREPWINEYASKKDFGNINFKIKIPTIFQRKYNLDRNSKDLLENLVDRYDSEINFLDKNIGKLFKKLPVEDNTLIVITSDHGEEFFEHNDLAHGNNLYNETIKIPLIIKFPASMNIKKGISIEENVGIIDIFPTILKILNIPADSKFDGKSLLSLIDSGKPFEKREIMSELYRGNKKILSLTQGKWKYIYDYRINKQELFDLSRDKDEIINLIDKNLPLKSYMENQLKIYLESVKKQKIKPQLVNPNKNTIEGLKSLGYIE